MNGVKRNAFTIVEVIIALGLLVVVMVVVAQLSFWSLRARQQNRDKEAALELANNILEAARSQAWKDLNDDWADRQQRASSGQDDLPDMKLAVRVAAEKGVPDTKRVTVALDWRPEPNLPPRQLELVGLFAARDTEKIGGKP